MNHGPYVPEVTPPPHLPAASVRKRSPGAVGAGTDSREETSRGLAYYVRHGHMSIHQLLEYIHLLDIILDQQRVDALNLRCCLVSVKRNQQQRDIPL